MKRHTSVEIKNNKLKSTVLRSHLRSLETSPCTSRSANITPRLEKSQLALAGNVNKLMHLFSEGREFKSKNNSNNHVFPIKDNNDVFAYLKVGSHGNEGSAAMETLMYYISVYFNVSDYFTETNIVIITPRKLKRLSISVDNKINNDNIPRRRSLSDCVSKDLVNASFQNALNGKTLEEYLSNGFMLNDIITNESVRMERFILTFFYIIAFGMFDAHSKNIMFENDQPKLIDNARSLPHSTELIKWGSTLQIAFRSALLEFDECYQELDSFAIHTLMKEVTKFQKKMKDFGSFLQRKEITTLLAKLPPGWFYPDLVIASINERVNRIYKGIYHEKVNKLEGLIHITFPHYRFFAILFIICEYLTNKQFIDIVISLKKSGNKNTLEDIDYEEFWKCGLLHTSHVCIIDNIDKCYFMDINPRKLLTECLSDNFSYINT